MGKESKNSNNKIYGFLNQNVIKLSYLWILNYSKVNDTEFKNFIYEFIKKSDVDRHILKNEDFIQIKLDVNSNRFRVFFDEYLNEFYDKYLVQLINNFNLYITNELSNLGISESTKNLYFNMLKDKMKFETSKSYFDLSFQDKVIYKNSFWKILKGVFMKNRIFNLCLIGIPGFSNLLIKIPNFKLYWIASILVYFFILLGLSIIENKEQIYTDEMDYNDKYKIQLTTILIQVSDKLIDKLIELSTNGKTQI